MSFFADLFTGFSSSTAAIATFAIAACTVVAAGFLWSLPSQAKYPLDHEDEEGVVSHELLDNEMASFIKNDPPISLLIWFRGDYREAAPFTKARVKMLLEVNPWLGGRIRKQRDKLLLRYKPTTKPKLEDHFEVIDHASSPFSRHTPIEQLAKASKGLLVKNGPTQSIWKVSIVPCHTNPHTNFAVVTSLSHIAADAHTCAKVNGALSSPATPPTLIPERIATSKQQQIDAMGRAEYNFETSASYLLGLLRGLLWSKTFGPPTKSRFVLVDQEKLAQVQRIAASQGDGSVSFVSTNDVLTSWFMQNTACSHGLMAVNFRNRLPGHTDNHVGNYHRMILFRRPDSALPTFIRKSAETFRRCVTTTEMPGVWEAFTGSYAVCSDVVSLAKPNAIGGLEELRVPLIDTTSLLPSNYAFMISFWSGPKGLALLMAGTPQHLQGLEDAPFLRKESLE